MMNIPHWPSTTLIIQFSNSFCLLTPNLHGVNLDGWNGWSSKFDHPFQPSKLIPWRLRQKIRKLIVLSLTMLCETSKIIFPSKPLITYYVRKWMGGCHVLWISLPVLCILNQHFPNLYFGFTTHHTSYVVPSLVNNGMLQCGKRKRSRRADTP